VPKPKAPIPANVIPSVTELNAKKGIKKQANIIGTVTLNLERVSIESRLFNNK
jgi:hypothetical protein